MKGKSSFTEATEYLTAVASVAAILAVAYYTWPIRQGPELVKESKVPIVKLDVAAMKTVYELYVSIPKFYKRHDAADKFFRHWGPYKAVIFPLGLMDTSMFRSKGVRSEDVDWHAELQEQANRRMAAPKDDLPKFDSILGMTSQLSFDEQKGVGFISAENIMQSISDAFSNKRLSPFTDAYSRNRTIFTPIVLENRSDVDALNVKAVINGAQYPGAGFLGIQTKDGSAVIAALPAHRKTWFFVRTTNAPVAAEDIHISQEGERVRGGWLLVSMGISAGALLIWRMLVRG